MKNRTKFLTCAALVASVSVPTLARTAPVFAPVTTAQAQQDAAAQKTDLYKRFLAAFGRKGADGKADPAGQAEAYQLGKEYVQKYSADTDQYITYIKNFVASYEKTSLFQPYADAYKSKNYPEMITRGKAYLAANPDDLAVVMTLGSLSLQPGNETNTQINTEAATFARQALQQIESGKAPADNKWSPFKDKDDAIGFLNYSLGVSSLRAKSYNDAAKYFVEASKHSTLKTEPVIYLTLATTYQSIYDPVRQQVVALQSADTPEAQALRARANGMIDNIIDAYARAVYFTRSNPQMQQRYGAQMTEWMTELTNFYKYRNNNSDATLQQFINGVAAKPLPSSEFAAATPATTNTPATPATPAATDPATTTTPATTTPATPSTPTNTNTPANTTPRTPATPAARPTPTPTPNANRPATGNTNQTTPRRP